MARLAAQVLLIHARNAIEREMKWKRTEEHAPPIPVGATAEDPAEELATLDVRLLQELGFRAFYDEGTKRSSWPVPFGMSPHELAIFGEERGVLYYTPERGDIFLQRALRRRTFAHAGLVTAVLGMTDIDERTYFHDTYTIEGDTDHRGLLRRGYTCKLRRNLSTTLGDRFLRWSELESESVAEGVA